MNVVIVFDFVGGNQSFSQRYTGCITAVHYIGLIGKRGSSFNVSQALPQCGSSNYDNRFLREKATLSLGWPELNRRERILFVYAKQSPEVL